MTLTQIKIDFDPICQKQGFIQYLSLFSTLDVILQDEDVLSVLHAGNDSSNNSANFDRKKLEMALFIGKTVFLVVIKMQYKLVFTMMILTL